MHHRSIGEYIGFALSFALFTTVLLFILNLDILRAAGIALIVTVLGGFVKRALV